MKDQELTSKYWVGHSKSSDDLFLKTGAKSLFKANERMQEEFGYDWMEDDDLEVLIISIEIAEPVNPVNPKIFTRDFIIDIANQCSLDEDQVERISNASSNKEEFFSLLEKYLGDNSGEEHF